VALAVRDEFLITYPLPTLHATSFPPLQFVLTNTAVPRKTSVLVAGVRTLREVLRLFSLHSRHLQLLWFTHFGLPLL
jgi:hypothetical protein